MRFVAIAALALQVYGDDDVGAAQPLNRKFAPDAFERLKQDVIGRSFAEAKELFAEAGIPTGTHGAHAEFPQNKIEHMVVLFVENRAADHIFGCMLGDHPEFDGIPTRKGKGDGTDGQHWQMMPYNAGTGSECPAGSTNKSCPLVNVSCGTADLVCLPHNNIHHMFNASQLPVKHAIAENFGIFNKMFTSVHGPSWPNHNFAQSATSCGTSSNVMYNDCGGDTVQFPQLTIYDSLHAADVPFAIFVNDTCGAQTNASCGSVSPGWGSNNKGNASNGLDPDVVMMGVARHKDRFFSHTLFYEQAAAGTLPAFSWISPKHEAADHPCLDLAKGERMLKDIYEALRGGKAWEKTLFVVTYDDYGGFYDHVPNPPSPNDESPCNVCQGLEPGTRNTSSCGLNASGMIHGSKCGGQMDFKRTGLRSSTMLISPWVKKASVINEPTKHADDGFDATAGPAPQWDHTSMLATAKNLFGLPGFLTKRDAWAGSFEELLLDTPRTDAPLRMPTPPPVAQPWGPPHSYEAPHSYKGQPISMRRLAEMDVLAGTAGPVPQHCSASSASGGDTCLGPNAVTAKQRRLIEVYSRLTQTPVPDLSAMDHDQAAAWSTARYNEVLNQH